MGSKIEAHLSDILSHMNEQDQKLYQELANYCQAAGLKPKKIYK